MAITPYPFLVVGAIPFNKGELLSAYRLRALGDSFAVPAGPNELW